jgi:hypothetical protein
MLRPEAIPSGIVCCAELAGASPVTVSAGAPCSRPRAEERSESLSGASKALTEPYGPGEGGKVAGLMREREPREPREIEAERRGGRAAHSTAKATDCASRPERRRTPPGYVGEACDDSSARNRRGPTRRLTSGEGGGYKPRVKGHRAGRESERLIVPLRMETRTPLEGRGLALVGSAKGVSARA